MIPKVQARGHSFKGIAQYLMNDTEEMTADAERVAWSATENLLTDDIETAAKVMAWTDQHSTDLKRTAGLSLAGRPQDAGNVYHFTLAWALGEQPDQDHMKEQVAATVEILGLSEHEHFMVAHSDREHMHVHVVANLVHPERGTVADLGLDRRKLQRWASDYEREHGIHCQVREDNRGRGVKNREQNRDYAPNLERAFTASDDGKSFVAALAYEGLSLATVKNNSKLYIVDEVGDVQALTRNLRVEGHDKDGKVIELTRRAKTAAIVDKLADLDRSQLPDANDLSKVRKAEVAAVRDSEEGEQQGKMLDAADDHGRKAGELLDKIDGQEKAALERIDSEFLPQHQDMELRQLDELKELETRLAKTLGQELKEVSAETSRMQGIVDGKGIGLTLRRVWRGKKDRAMLDDLKAQKSDIGAHIHQAREKMAEIHDQEKRDLANLHHERREALKTRMDQARKKLHFEKAGRGVKFSDMSAVRQVETLQKMKDSKRGLAKSEGARRSLDAAKADRNKRLDKRIWDIRRGEKQKAKDAATQREMIARRAEAEGRAQEIKSQGRAEDNEGRTRLQRQTDALRERLAQKSKDRGFEP